MDSNQHDSYNNYKSNLSRHARMTSQAISTSQTNLTNQNKDEIDLNNFFNPPINIKVLLHTLNSINECISITDLNDKIIFVNKAFLTTYGYSLNDIIGEKIDFLRSEKNDPEVLEKIHTETLNGGWHGRIYNIRKDGSELVIDLSTSIVRDEEGHPIAFVGISRDISDIIQTEEKLRHAENKYQELFLELKDIVYESSVDGKFIELNPSGLEFFGIKSIDELKNIDITKDIYLHPEDRKRFTQELIKNGFVKDFEIEIKKLNGEIVTVLETSTAVKNNKGEIIGYRGILRDISDRKRNEANLKHLIEKLESLNKELKKSEEELKNINASKDKFFSILAHDLRSPFSSLLSFSEFLYQDIEELSKEEIKTFAENIHEAAKNVFSLLENLLQWSRIQTGKIPYKPKHFNIYNCVNKVINLLSNNAAMKKIILINNVDSEHSVYADEDMIFSVLQNLLSNAIKFTQESGEIILNSSKKENELEISVTDNGVGIKEEDLDKLFRIDAQFTTAGTNAEKGSGLGLIICKEMVEKNKGKIWVKSKQGEGTTFTFSLPINKT